MRVKVLLESIKVRTVGEPPASKEVLDITLAFGIDQIAFTFDIPLEKSVIVSKIKETTIEVLTNREKADKIRKWLVEHGLSEIDTDEL